MAVVALGKQGVNTQDELLRLEQLTVSFRLPQRKVLMAVDGVSLTINRGEAYGLIGESGSGKTVTALAALGLLETNALVGGGIAWRGKNFVGRPERDWRKIRGSGLTMLFQNAQASLNPALRIGKQLEAVIKLRQSPEVAGAAVRDRALEMLTAVRMSDPERVFDAYPHELSGGMAQRTALAIALACRPALLIADEPTSSLDVTVAVQIVDLFKQIRAEFGLALLVISHDISVIERLCDKISVMRGGKVVESGTAAKVISNPQSGYTKELIEASTWQPQPIAPP